MWSIAEASRLTTSLLEAELPRRLKHVRATGHRASVLRHMPDDDRQLMAIAGTLHDIGYAPDLVEVGFHPIDGARFLRSDGWDETIVNLVAHHSCAAIEAERRGLLAELNGEFSRNDSLPHDELCFCDMTTGPAGQLMTVEQRLADIKERYGAGSIVGDSIALAEPELLASVYRVQAKIDSA
ncbi:MAG: HD domain-containing protein [Acidimicrobiales bacterium]